MNKASVIDKLKKILGEDRILTQADKLEQYAGDMTEAEPHMPTSSASPHHRRSRAHRENGQRGEMPRVPCVARTNLGGLSIATHGGIIVDFTKMTKFSRSIPRRCSS